MGATFIETIGSVFELIPDLFTSLSAIFWTPGSGADSPGSLTFVGTLALIGVGLALCWVAFRVIRGFMHLRG